MDIIYIVYALLSLAALTLNIVVLVLRLRRKVITPLHGISSEHKTGLIIQDVCLASVSIVSLLSSIRDAADSPALCHFTGFCIVYALQALTWLPITTGIILYERERYSLRMKTHQEMSARIVIFISGAIFLISVGLVGINYAPITEFDKNRRLACVPLLFPGQIGSEYSKLQLVLLWLGLLAVWGCMWAWVYFILRNKRSVRYVTECYRSTKPAAFQVFFRISLWTITIIQYSIFYWTFNDDVVHSAIFFSILYLIGCPCCSLIGYWFGHTERQLNASLSRDIPAQLDDITPLTVNPDKNLMKFHANWQGKFSERIHGVIKLYVSSERNKWLKEAQAMLLLRKTEHPNIVKYLWVSRGKSIQFPMEKLSQEYRNLLTDANNRMVCMQYYEHGSLRDLLLHRHSLITDATLRYVSLDIASALVHLRQLHIVHSKLTSKSVFIRSTPKNKMVTAAIGNFEESERVTLDHHTQEQGKITSEYNVTAQLDNKFAADIRSYALLVLELVAAWNKHNGEPIKVRENKKSAHKSPYYLQRPLPVKPGTATGTSQQRNRRNRRISSEKSRSLSRLPSTFDEISEAQQSHLYHQTTLRGGEQVAIEQDEPPTTVGIEAQGVILPNTLSPGSNRRDVPSVHRQVGRQFSNSTCSVDSGYTRSLGSSAAAYAFYDLGSSASKLGLKANTQNSAMQQLSVPKHPVSKKDSGVKRMLGSTDSNNNSLEGELHVISIHEGTDTASERIASPTTCTQGKLLGNTTRLSPEALQHMKDYMTVKQALPADILSEYEEFNLPDDAAASDEEKIYETVSPHVQKEKETQQTAEPMTLTALAELVTKDVNVFLRSRTNSDASSLQSNTSKNHRRQPSDCMSRSSDASYLTFSSTAEKPLNVRLDRELFLDKIISSKNTKANDNTSSSSRFIYRAGINKAQLYYSKELSTMYEIITPQLLYNNEKTTRELLAEYRQRSLSQPTITQLLLMSEKCWLEEPVSSANLLQSQIRRSFSSSTSIHKDLTSPV